MTQKDRQLEMTTLREPDYKDNQRAPKTKRTTSRRGRPSSMNTLFAFARTASLPFLPTSRLQSYFPIRKHPDHPFRAPFVVRDVITSLYPTLNGFASSRRSSTTTTIPSVCVLYTVYMLVAHLPDFFTFFSSSRGLYASTSKQRLRYSLQVL